MENSSLVIALLVVMLLFLLVYLVLGTIRQRRLNLLKLVLQILCVVEFHVKEATAVHHTPPRDGPSFAIHRYTSPQFSCEVGVPHHSIELQIEDGEPSTLAYIEGFLGRLSAATRDMIHNAFPSLHNGNITHVHYAFLMSNEGDRGTRVRRGVEVQLEIGIENNETFECSFCLTEKDIANEAVDYLFRKITRQ